MQSFFRYIYTSNIALSKDLMLISKNSNETFSVHDFQIEELEYDFKDGNKWKPLQKHYIDKYVEIEDNKYNLFLLSTSCYYRKSTSFP